MNITITEIEMLAGILARAGVNQIEAYFCNGILDQFRALALGQQAGAALEQQAEAATEQRKKEIQDKE